MSTDTDALRALRNLLDRYHVMGCGDGPEALEAARILAQPQADAGGAIVGWVCVGPDSRPRWNTARHSKINSEFAVNGDDPLPSGWRCVPLALATGAVSTDARKPSLPHEGDINPAEVILPCDVHLPPATRIRRGCRLSTLLTALDARARKDGTSYETLVSEFPTEPTQSPADGGEK